MRILKIALIAAMGFAMLGCTTPPSEQTTRTSFSTNGSAVEICSFEIEHQSADGLTREPGYYCAPFLASSANKDSDGGYVSSSGCSFVAAYQRKDGTFVGPFTRCKTYAQAVAYQSVTASANPAPCVNSYCGPVQVKGYYRKDGTYVRPHSRKK